MLTHPNALPILPSMRAELLAQFRIAGVVRSPEREGAIAHFDPDRGFALVARGLMGPTDLIDPTIWVKEKIGLALSAPGDPSDSPLRRVIGALRALHGELMARQERDRAWVSVLVLILLGEDAVAVSAGDCPCFRFRSGLLSRLGRVEADAGAAAPKGALGSEPQVRIEIVPLRPPPGDVYLLSTRPLRDGELAVLSRDLASARDGTQLLRAGVEGASDRGRIAIRVLEPSESDEIAFAADSLHPTIDAFAPVEIDSSVLEPEEETEEAVAERDGSLLIDPYPTGDEELIGEPASATHDEWARGLGRRSNEELIGAPQQAAETMTPVEEPDFGESGGFYDTDLPAVDPEPGPAPSRAPSPAPEAVESRPPEDAWTEDAEPTTEPSAPRTRTRSLSTVGEERPWFEPLALWAGGALAIVALALLVKSLLPGILGTPSSRAPEPRPVAAATGLADIFSEPPGATVRVDGVALEGKTPLVGVSLDAGLHRIELDWGPWGVWRDTMEVAAGTRLTVHPALYGSATFRSSDPSRALDVYLDGVYAGTTPLELPKVVVGRHLVRFGGPGLTTSAQEVEVLRDTPIELVGNAGQIPEDGKLTVRTAILGDMGFESGKGDPYWVDGTARGVTPATLELKPGTHSVRVARRGFPPQISVIDVKAGGEHFVTAEFGARSEEPLRFDPPETVYLSNPIPLTIALPASEWDPSMALWLYAAAPSGSFQAKRMTRLEEGTRTFAALLPPEVLRSSARQVRFYFKATGTGGREIYSEIYTVPVKD